jgi:hypothetical protein
MPNRTGSSRHIRIMKPSPRFGWKPALLVAIAGVAAACGSSDTLTSVYLEIYDSSVIQGPTNVTVNVFDGPGGKQIATLDPKASAQTSPSSLLGSVVILPPSRGALGTLHIEGERLSGGIRTSWGSVDVPLIMNQQVTARLMLGHDAGAADAGAGAGMSGGLGGGSGSGGMPGGSGGGSSSGGAGTGAGGSGGIAPPADAGSPPVDSGPTLAANGTSCQSAGACASGFCVDGVCCDSACDTLCHACNLGGSRGACNAVAAGTQCASPSCATNGIDLIPARTCDSSGGCSAAGNAVSCGRYRCQNAACLSSCVSSFACVSPYRCFQNRCQ